MKSNQLIPGLIIFPKNMVSMPSFSGGVKGVSGLGVGGVDTSFFLFFRFFFCISKLQSGIPGVLVLVFKSEQDS